SRRPAARPRDPSSLPGLLPFGQGLVHGAGFRDDAVGEAPRRDALPPAGPSVVAGRLFDGGPFEHREEVEDPEARAVRLDMRPLGVREVLADPVVAEIEETRR